MPPLFPSDPPQSGQGVVLITLNTGLEIEAEWDGYQWWAHLNDNPQAAPISNDYVTSWRLLE